MFDDLRDASKESKFAEKPSAESRASSPVLASKPAKKKPSGGKILGMNAFQRFVISFLLFMVTCVAGTALLIVLGKVALPL
jgi:hypothetical protein